jgi:WD40 repeat protein
VSSSGKIPTIGHRKVPNIYSKFLLLSKLISSIDVFLFPTGVLAHKRGVKCFQYSYLNSQFWVTGGYDCAIRIYDINTAQCFAQYIGHRSIITDLKVTRKDQFIISVSFDRTVKVWNVQTGNCEKTLTGHADGITSCDLSPDQRYLVTSSLDMTARVWDLSTYKTVSILKRHSKWIKVVRFSPDGNYIVTASLDHNVYIWDLKVVLISKNMTYFRCIDSHKDTILSISMSKPNLLLTSSRDQTVRLFDYTTGSELYSISMSPSWACCVAFSSDGQLFATGSFDNTISLFRTKNGEKVRQLRIFNLGILSVGFPDNDQYVLCGTSDGFIQQIPL